MGVIFNVQISWNYCYDGGNRNCGSFAYCSGACGRLCCWGGSRRIWYRRYCRKRTHAAGGVCRSTAACLLCAATAASLLRGRGLWTSISYGYYRYRHR